MTNTYREVLYLFLQRFIYRGQMALFGTTSNPVGCAVAYRRKYLAALFDHFEPLLGDDLTNSEDIFIGLAMLNEGYRNIHLTDVYARTVEPEVQRLPRQVYLWSSAFLQSSFYFDALLKSPFKAHRRWRRRRDDNGSNGPRPTSRQRSIPSHAAGRLEPAMAAAGHATSAGPAPISLGALFFVASENRGALSIEWPPNGTTGSSASPLPTTERRRNSGAVSAGVRERAHEGLRPSCGFGPDVVGGGENFFPTVLLMMGLWGNWEAVIVTVCAETLLWRGGARGGDEGAAASVSLQEHRSHAYPVCIAGVRTRDHRAIRIGHLADEGSKVAQVTRPDSTRRGARALRRKRLRSVGESRGESRPRDLQ